MYSRPRPDVFQGTAEVRVLGTLRARRTDGTMVPPRDWRTGQTADLLRLLALHVDEPVPVDVLLEALWPAVDEKRGRASLRSAASRIRTALGEGCVVRRLGGLVLTNAWVDAHAFTALAREARRHVVTGALAQAVTTTREAESLYLDEFRAHHDGADWALAERATLSATYRQMLADAADAAVSLSWWYDAVDLAERSLAADPLSERAYRALMRGYRGLGETSRALQVYERCRRTLADEVGADPSPSTQALHMELLSDEPVESPPPPFCGRDHERSWLRQATERAAATARPEVVIVHGPAGAGVSRLLDETWPAGAASALRLSAGPQRDVCVDLRAALPEQMARSSAGSAEPAVAVIDDAGLLDAGSLNRLAGELTALRGPASVVVAGRTTAGGFPTVLQQALARALGARLSVLPLAPLAEEEIAQLCSGVLQGQVSEPLTEAVVAQSGGVPGRALDLVCDWASSGRVASTSAGLVVVQTGRADVGTTVRQELASAVDRLSPTELEVMQLVGVIGRPAPRDLLLPLVVVEGEVPTESERQELQHALDRLCDLTLLTSSDAGYAPRDPLLNDALLTWMRPSSLRRLHRRVAEQAHIPASERVEHWLEAAEPQLAMAAALDATAEAISAGRYEIARRHLRQLCQAPAMAEAAPSDRAELFERLGDVCLRLGRVHEAHEAYSTAVDAAREGGSPDLARLEEKRTSSVDRPGVPEAAIAGSFDGGRDGDRDGAALGARPDGGPDGRGPAGEGLADDEPDADLAVVSGLYELAGPGDDLADDGPDGAGVEPADDDADAAYYAEAVARQGEQDGQWPAGGRSDSSADRQEDLRSSPDDSGAVDQGTGVGGAVGNGAVGDGAVGDGAVGDGAVGDGAAQHGAAAEGAVDGAANGLADGVVDGVVDGAVDGVVDGATDGVVTRRSPLPPIVRPGTPPDVEVEARLQGDVAAADAQGDSDARARARAVLVRTVYVPRREFRRARQCALDGLSLTREPSRRAELLVADALPGAVLGNGRVVEPLLRRASALAVAGTDPEAVADLLAMRALVAHDLGRAEQAELHRKVETAGGSGSPGEQAWVLVRTATERGDLEAAERADRVRLPSAVAPAVRQLRDCASAALAMERGRLEEAREKLLGVLDVAEQTGTTLMVPEAATRLVLLEAPVDLVSARRRFELFEWAAGGESWLPRETVLRLLARAAVRAADGRPDDAASAAAAAADTAESTGLVHLAVAAHRRRASHLSAAGRPSEARLATAAASRWRELAAAGVPPAAAADGREIYPPGGPRRTGVPRQDGPRQERERRDDPPERSRRGR